MANFKLTSAYRYWFPITFQVPDPEKSGKFLTQTCELLFEAMPLADLTTRMEERAKAAPSVNFGEDDAAFLEEVTFDWRGVEEDDGNPAQFDAAAFRRALQFTWFRNAALEGYQKSVSSQAARRGN